MKWSGCLVVGVIACSAASSVQADMLVPSLGNFPDAVNLTAEFGSFTNLNINGDTINATGFLFQLQNTSWGDGFHSSFVNDPDGDFAVGDVLTPAAAAAIDAAQPFGIYSFGAELPTGAGATVSSPTGFGLNIQSNGPGKVEVNFTVNLGAGLDRLLFDPSATGINGIFTNAQTGTFSFFISTLSANLLDNLLAEDNGLPAMDVATEMVWEEAGVHQTVFGFNDAELRPRGEMVVPAPGAFVLGLLGMATLAARRNRLP